MTQSRGALAYRQCVNPDCLAEEGDRHEADCTPEAVGREEPSTEDFAAHYMPLPSDVGRQTTHDPNEDDRVKAEIGECLYAGDHEDVGGVCIHCGAEFDD